MSVCNSCYQSVSCLYKLFIHFVYTRRIISTDTNFLLELVVVVEMV